MAEPSPPLRHYLRFLRRQGWLIVLVPAVAIAFGLYLVSRQESIYRAKMGIFVAQAGGQFQPQLGTQPLTQTMTNILESEVIARRVVDELNLPITSGALLKKLRVKVKPDSSVLDVSYDSPNKRRAVIVLNQVAKEFKVVIRETLGAGTLKNSGPFRIVATVFNPPHLEPRRVSPQPVKVLSFAGALGLALGLIFAFARESLDNRLRGRRDAEEWYGAPVIGALPRAVRGKPPASIASKPRRNQQKVIEALQLLRANYQFSAGLTGPTLLVTSALDREGKTTVVANLSMALAMAGKDVICVEADVRRPALHRLLGAPEPAPGLVDVVEGRIGVDEALHEIELFRPATNGGQPAESATGTATSSNGPARGSSFGGRLRLLPAGQRPANPAAVLSAERIGELVKDLSARASYVIFDSPPLLSAGEALPLALNVDSVIVVARQGRTTRERARAVRATLDGLGTRQLAVVIMDAREALPVKAY